MSPSQEQINDLLRILPEGTRRCGKCKKVKPVSEFNRKKQGYSSYCRTCNSENLKKHYRENTQYYLDKSKKRKQSLKAIIDELKLKLGCAECGFDKHPAALDFHHRAGEIKLFSISGSYLNVSITALVAEIEKCDVLCANCHRIKTWG